MPNRVNVEEKNDVDADHDMPDFERMSRMGGMISKELLSLSN